MNLGPQSASLLSCTATYCMAQTAASSCSGVHSRTEPDTPGNTDRCKQLCAAQMGEELCGQVPPASDLHSQIRRGATAASAPSSAGISAQRYTGTQPPQVYLPVLAGHSLSALD